MKVLKLLIFLLIIISLLLEGSINLHSCNCTNSSATVKTSYSFQILPINNSGKTIVQLGENVYINVTVNNDSGSQTDEIVVHLKINGKELDPPKTVYASGDTGDWLISFPRKEEAPGIYQFEMGTISNTIGVTHVFTGSYEVKQTIAENAPITVASSSTTLSYTPTTQTVSSIVPSSVLPEETSSTTPTTRVFPNIAGQWQWNLTVTVATGPCAGEEGPQAPRTVKITQNGKDVTISGFLSSNPSTSLSGEITFDNAADKWIVKFSGRYAEDQGTTQSNYTLVLNNTFDKMTGDEEWDWIGGGQSCTGSKSTVVANKLP